MPFGVRQKRFSVRQIESGNRQTQSGDQQKRFFNRKIQSDRWQIGQVNCRNFSGQIYLPFGSLKLVSVFCSACISASDSRNASVDSAP